MFSWIIGSSLRFRFLVLRKMSVDVFGEFAPPKV